MQERIKWKKNQSHDTLFKRQENWLEAKYSYILTKNQYENVQSIDAISKVGV